ncbi:flagellar motor protein MotB [bacterium]|nr:flagellar motor protein MotB [bacterium]
MAKKQEECPPKGAPAWMTTYGDMVTLLLTFFVLLLSFSSMREAKFRRAMGSLKGALGVLPFEQSVLKPEIVPIPQLTNLQESEIAESIVKMEDILSDQQLTENVRLQITDKGMTITLESEVMFEAGSSELKPVAFKVLTRIATLARGWPNTMRIEGHTDNDPIKTAQYPSNWELSSSRAMNVLHFFQDYGEYDPRNLFAIGKGEYHPIVPNDTPANKAKNRRIEIHIDYDPDVKLPVKVQSMMK